jgi:hypothetical protein
MKSGAKDREELRFDGRVAVISGAGGLLGLRVDEANDHHLNATGWTVRSVFARTHKDDAKRPGRRHAMPRHAQVPGRAYG